MTAPVNRPHKRPGPPKRGLGSAPKRGSVCLYCRCIDVRGWASPGVCVECVAVATAWNHLTAEQKPKLLWPFVRGFWAATDDERALDAPTRNPFAGDAATYWRYGLQAAHPPRL